MKADVCGSCGEPIYWLRHEKTGKPAPVEVKETAAGNAVVNLLAGTYHLIGAESRAMVCKAYEGEGTPPLHLNHFAACPQAKTWAKAGRA